MSGHFCRGRLCVIVVVDSKGSRVDTNGRRREAVVLVVELVVVELVVVELVVGNLVKALARNDAI